MLVKVGRDSSTFSVAKLQNWSRWRDGMGGGQEGGGLNVALFAEPEMNDLRSGSIERGWRV